MAEQYLSVSALTKYLKRKFDADPHLQKVWVVGEVSNFRPRPNSHQYFSLKDGHARISAVMYKSAFAKVPFQLEEGMKVLVVGHVSLYEPSGQYQLTINSIEPDGIGALYQALAQLKEKFQKAGLFEQLQRPIERFPKKIAVITSPTGAVIRDILTTLKRRYPIVQVTVFPTRVQGKESVGEIVAAFEQVKEHASEFDTVIVARGGGSIEDLWSFNEEAVAQAILGCPIPVISSIGHETDTTIADLVADLRAPTPTAAAELAVPVLSEVLAQLAKYQEQLMRAVLMQLSYKQKSLANIQKSHILRQPERLYETYAQQLDRIEQQLVQQQQNYLQNKKHRLVVEHQKLLNRTPQHRIQRTKQKIDHIQMQLSHAIQRQLQQRTNHFKERVVQLNAYNPLDILVRGYAVVSSKKHVIKSVEQVDVGDTVEIQVVDGTITSQVTAMKQKGV